MLWRTTTPAGDVGRRGRSEMEIDPEGTSSRLGIRWVEQHHMLVVGRRVGQPGAACGGRRLKDGTQVQRERVVRRRLTSGSATISKFLRFSSEQKSQQVPPMKIK
jgi:hypothetical protein